MDRQQVRKLWDEALDKLCIENTCTCGRGKDKNGCLKSRCFATELDAKKGQSLQRKLGTMSTNGAGHKLECTQCDCGLWFNTSDSGEDKAKRWNKKKK